MKGFVGEFKKFISRGGVLDLAVAIVIGLAFTTVVNSFVDDILNAFIGAVVGKPNFNDLTLEIGDGVIRYGSFITALINFVIIAFALFLIVKALRSVMREAPVAPALPSDEVLLLTEIRDALRTRS